METHGECSPALGTADVIGNANASNALIDLLSLGSGSTSASASQKGKETDFG